MVCDVSSNFAMAVRRVTDEFPVPSAGANDPCDLTSIPRASREWGQIAKNPFIVSLRSQRCSLQVRVCQGLAYPSSNLSSGTGFAVSGNTRASGSFRGSVRSNMVQISAAEWTEWGLPSGDRNMFGQNPSDMFRDSSFVARIFEKCQQRNT